MNDTNGCSSGLCALVMGHALGTSAMLLVLMFLGAATPSARSSTTQPATDEDLSLTSMPLSRLEEHYWACDHLIAHSMPTTAEMEQCSMVYETLRQRRFGGSTEKFVQWLKQRLAPAGIDTRRAREGVRT